MSSDYLFTKSVSASEFFTRFQNVLEQAFQAEPLNITINTNGGALTLSLSSTPAKNLPMNDLGRLFVARTAERSYLSVVNATAVMTNNGNMQLQYVCDDGIVGKFRIHTAGDLSRASQILSALEKHFPITSYADLVGNTSPAIDTAAISMRERSVADLREQIGRLATFLADLSANEIEHRRNLQSEMDRSYQSRVKELDDQYRNRQSLLDEQKNARENELADKERQYQDRVSQFETREAKYMRRDLLKEIRKVLAESENMALSGPTGEKRSAIHWTAGLALLTFGSTAGVMVWKLMTTSQFDWHILGPFSAAFLAFGGTIIYYLKWNDRWFREHADAEFAAKRYKADILRASWIAELVQEWIKEAKDQPLPTELLEAYTRNLFRDVGATRLSEHPVDHLTAIMKRATEFQIGKGLFSVRSDPAKPKSGPA